MLNATHKFCEPPQNVWTSWRYGVVMLGRSLYIYALVRRTGFSFFCCAFHALVAFKLSNRQRHRLYPYSKWHVEGCLGEQPLLYSSLSIGSIRDLNNKTKNNLFDPFLPLYLDPFIKTRGPNKPKRKENHTKKHEQCLRIWLRLRSKIKIISKR
jgi:hypothetical protein